MEMPIPSPSAGSRDSHDLSLSPRDVTRDSLVTNMLLSLDQLSMGQQQQQQQQRHPPRRRQHHHHHHQHAEPAGVAAGRDASPSTKRPTSSKAKLTSGQHVHRRNGSHASDSSRFSSTHQGTPASSSTVRESKNKSDKTTNGKGGKSRGRRKSKTKSKQERDATYHHRPTTPPPTAYRRSGTDVDGSIDGEQRPVAATMQPLITSSPFRVDFPKYDDDDDDDDDDDGTSAPTPTVPIGPRRVPSDLAISLIPPPPPPKPSASQTTERRRSTIRSFKDSPRQGRRATRATAMASPEFDSAPAPSVGYGKSNESDATPAKERQGFFRRVFGGGASSRNAGGNLATSGGAGGNVTTTGNGSGSSNAASCPPRLASSSRPDRSRQQGQSDPAAASSSRDASLPCQPPLQKKSSTASFFRRRRKADADYAPATPAKDTPRRPPPFDPVVLPAPEEHPPSAPRSPAASLRDAMSPYLTDSPTPTGSSLVGPPSSESPADVTGSPGTTAAARDGYRKDFSPEYSHELSPNARIRTVRPDTEAEPVENPETPSRPAPAPPTQTAGSNKEKVSFRKADGGLGLNLDLDVDAGSEFETEVEDKHGTSRRRQRASVARDGDKDKDGKKTAKLQDGNDASAFLHRGKKCALVSSEPTGHEPLRPNLVPSMDGSSLASSSTDAGYRTAPSAPPSVRVDSAGDRSPTMLGTPKLMKSYESLDEPECDAGEPTDDDRQKARSVFDGCEDFVPKPKAAAWLGEEGPGRQRTLQAYMELHDFTDQGVLAAMRSLCGRLVLRAETQQVDRILVAFSKRWCACNPRHGFKATDVIHMICYSIMLLNTDLHLADIEQKMTRSQFVKNTMTTIAHAAHESAPAAATNGRPTILPEKSSLLSGVQGRSSPDYDRSSLRYSFRPLARSDPHGGDVDDCGPLVKAPFHGSMRAWEEQVEVVLKNIYASIRDQRLPLFGAEAERQVVSPTLPPGNLSVISMLRRSPSVLSKAPSETQLSSRGRVTDGRGTASSRWTSKSRSRPGLGRTGLSSSRTSFDDGNSMWSHTMSTATWSRYSLGRTQGSMSQDSFASSVPRGDYKQSIGFANALSQAIIRDEDASGHEPSFPAADAPPAPCLADESLELAGPPWVKEGLVTHKHHLDGVGKKAKERNWNEVFAVIQKGQMSLFSFTSHKSIRQKGRSRNGGKPSGPVGGGNWQDNALSLGTFSLRLTLASALPPPGYSRMRPHVWALSLPTGAVHLFQVGTPEIIREFVTTVNYWSARLSTHPLVGGISNIEYGWSESIVSNASVGAPADDEPASSLNPSAARSTRPGSSAAQHGRRSSVASSFRASSFDQVAGSLTHSGSRGKLPGDRIYIAEWAPPTQSMRPSSATEAAQLEKLTVYVKRIEEDLQAHNQLRSRMLLAFTPRGQNASKAMANWERKSAYLLREIVKFRTYVDCLQQAEARKQRVYTERDLERGAARGDDSDDEMAAGGVDGDDEEDGDETLRP
ncbi:hypothetical protein RJ55_08596 [Drechmeria coniospora]|nr:hypothetical protein RJ55_08596 [Drechmeria coniospora]